LEALLPTVLEGVAPSFLDNSAAASVTSEMAKKIMKMGYFILLTF